MISFEKCCGLDCSHLVSCPKREDLLGEREALLALDELKTAALKDGFRLEICSAWRSFARQLGIVAAKMDGRRPVLDENERALEISTLDLRSRLRAVMRFSALPGFSRHHFGTDFDVYAENCLPPGQKLQLTAFEYDSYFFEFGNWLSANLEKYGFMRPFSGKGLCAFEPWHISYFPRSEAYLASFDLSKAQQILRSSGMPWADEAALIAAELFENLFS